MDTELKRTLRGPAVCWWRPKLCWTLDVAKF